MVKLHQDLRTFELQKSPPCLFYPDNGTASSVFWKHKATKREQCLFTGGWTFQVRLVGRTTLTKITLKTRKLQKIRKFFRQNFGKYSGLFFKNSQQKFLDFGKESG